MITQLKQKPYNYGIRRGKPPLDYGMVSNGIKSAPQLCKWHLQDGVITLEAGSIVRWAAGKKAPTLNIGDTYLGYPIVDISWDGTNLIYYTQTQKDYSWTFNTYTGLVQMFLQDAVGAEFWGLQTDMIQSGNTPPSETGNRNYYNTDNNTCLHLRDSVKQSFPIMEVYLKAGEGVINITEVYNTGGKMGSSVWLNKNVTLNLTNKLNSSDCSFNSVDFTTKHDYMGTMTGNLTRSNSQMWFGFTNDTSEPTYWLSTITNWDPANNINQRVMSPYGIELINACCVGYNLNVRNDVIYSYTPLMPFRAADAQNIDGRTIFSTKEVLSRTTINSKQVVTIDISSFLPNDGKMYEVTVNAAATTSAANGNTAVLYVGSDIQTTNICLFGTQTRANAGVVGYGSAVVPVGAQRHLKISNVGNAPAIAAFAALVNFKQIH